jgi:hypothetical protein
MSGRADQSHLFLPERRYTAGDVAALAGVCSRTVGKWLDRGLLAGWKMPGRGWRFFAGGELLRFFESWGMDPARAKLLASLRPDDPARAGAEAYPASGGRVPGTESAEGA